MNKKVLMFGLPLFAIAFVTALVVLNFSVSFNTSQAIFLDGDLTQELPEDCKGGETCIGTPVIISNEADVNADLKLVNDEECEDVEVSYVSRLLLTKKDTSTWGAVGEPIEVYYTLVGETFEYNVELPEGFILVYAMDKENRFSEYATVIKAEDIDESLPYLGDWNANADPNYCNLNNSFDSYEHCVGAKLWAINEEDLGTETEGVYELSWANMGNYFYESDLVYYFANENSEVTVPAESYLTIYPLMEVETLAEDGNCKFTISLDD